MMYQKKSLDALLLFFSENTPLPIQSDKKTKKIFRRLRRDLYREISANLAGRRKTYAKLYLVYLTCKLKENRDAFLKLKTVPLKALEAALPDRDWKAPLNEKTIGLDGNTFWDGSPEDRMQKFVSITWVYTEYLNTTDKVLAFADSCMTVAQKSRRSYPEQDGLSGKLVRKQEQLFWDSLHHEPIADVPQEIKYLNFKKKLIRATAANLGLEIERNLKNFDTDITTPYLELLKERLRGECELSEDRPAASYRFATEWNEAVRQKYLAELDLQMLLMDVERIRKTWLRDTFENIEKQLATGGQSGNHIYWGMPLNSKHRFFLTMIMNGMASDFMEDDHYRDPSEFTRIFLGIPASKVLKKIKRLQDAENWTEQEREDFYRVKGEVEARSVHRWEIHRNSNVPDAVTERLSALQEVEKFLKLWEARSVVQ